MEKIKELQKILLQGRDDPQAEDYEFVLFIRDTEFGVSLYDSNIYSSDTLESIDSEYADSLEEAIDKAIKRWS